MDQFPKDREPITPEQKPLRDLRAERMQIAFPALGIVFIFVFSAVLQLTLDALIRSFAPDLASADWYAYAIAMLPMYLVAMPLSLLFFRPAVAEPPERKKLSFPVLLGLAAICFALSYAGSFLGNFVNLIFALLRGQEAVNPVQSMTAGAPLWANLLFMGIAAPIMEEIFYRKLVIDRLRRYGDLPAILLSGIAFGLIHGNFSQFFYAAVLGCVFGYVYLRTGDIRYTIALHMGINLVGGVYASEIFRYLDLELLARDPMSILSENLVGMLMYLAYLAFMGITVIGGIVAFILLFKYWRAPLRRAEASLNASEWGRVLILNPGVLILLAFVAFMFLTS